MVEQERGTVANLNDDIAAYDSMRAQLEAEHMGQWAVVFDRNLIGIFTSFEAAAEVAVTRFGRGPYLIRQIGAPPVVLPASVMYRPSHADSSVRVA